jgi:hypothetical protein
MGKYGIKSIKHQDIYGTRTTYTLFVYMYVYIYNIDMFNILSNTCNKYNTTRHCPLNCQVPYRFQYQLHNTIMMVKVLYWYKYIMLLQILAFLVLTQRLFQALHWFNRTRHYVSVSNMLYNRTIFIPNCLQLQSN